MLDQPAARDGASAADASQAVHVDRAALVQFCTHSRQNVCHECGGRHAKVAHAESFIAKIELPFLGQFTDQLVVGLEPIPFLCEVDERANAGGNERVELPSCAFGRDCAWILAGEKPAFENPVGVRRRWHGLF